MKAIISGASRGIGRAIARELAALNYDLILLARNEKDLKKIRTELSNGNNYIDSLAIDLTKSEELLKLKSFIESFSDINLLINNLGTYLMDKPSELKKDDLGKMLEVNLYSTIKLSQIVLPHLKKNENSRIINIGSVMSLISENIATSYSISKHAMKAWNDALREELRSKKIKVSTIYPGAVNTSSWDGIQTDKDSMIQSEDVAKMVGTICQLSPSTLIEEVRMSPLNFNE